MEAFLVVGRYVKCVSWSFYVNAWVYFKGGLLTDFTGVNAIQLSAFIVCWWSYPGMKTGFLFLFARFSMIVLLVWIEPWHFLPLPQDSASSPPRGHTGNGSVFVNEAALASTSVNNRHVHHRRNDASTHNCLNSLLAQSNGRQPPGAKTPHGQHSDSQGWMMGTGYLYSPAGRHGKNYHKVQFQS